MSDLKPYDENGDFHKLTIRPLRESDANGLVTMADLGVWLDDKPLAVSKVEIGEIVAGDYRLVPVKLTFFVNPDFTLPTVHDAVATLAPGQAA
jgi:hypothetical protein